MTFNIYAIKDLVGQQFGDLKLFNSDALAIRWFNHFCKESPFGKDLQLFKLGMYQSVSGEIVSTGVEFVCAFDKGVE